MIWSITKSNIKKNFSLYRIYFLATIGLLSIFIAFLNFISDKIIAEKIGDSGQALVIANGSLVFLTVFLVIFLIYFNNFFVKKRSQELGVLAILGFSKRELTKLLTLENLVILVLSYLVSLLLGPTLYFLAVLVITHLLNLTMEVQWFITVNEIIESLGILVVVFLINFITNGLIISKQSLIEFVNFSRKAEKKIRIRKVRAIIAITALLLSYVLCLATVFSSTRNMLLSIGMGPISLLIIILIIFGTIFTVRYGLTFVISLLKENKKRLYRPLSNIIYPKFNYRIATKNKLLTVLGGLLTLTVSVTGIMVMLYAYSLNGIERLTPSAIEYNVESENGQVNVTNILENNQVSLVDVDLLRLNTTPEVTITESGQTIPYFDIINYSDYKELMKAQGRTNSIEGSESLPLLINYYPTEISLGKTFNLENVYDVTVKQVSTNNVFSFSTSVTTLVVSDKLYAELSSRFPEKEMTIRTFNGNSIRSNETFYNQFSAVPDVISSYSREYTVKTANIATYIFITFLSILFIICTGSILYFTSLIEIMENKEEYGYLSKLGYSKKLINRILGYETGILFLIPVLIGIVNGSMLLSFYKYLFMDTLVAGNIIMLSLLLCLFFFLIIYGTFYLLTLRSVKSIINN
ncbi:MULTISPECIES: ABC transporter permease [Streptococcus dysgalactiae group]|nr:MULTISPECIES: FtsX-like permease family protein [Streptococcus dysgalactiae group]QJD61277.1 FtsX-like permease family protein [Streptococcus dysgalactiae subsp. equisimilis]QJD63127.1 FtsX-like permease family protein [Streptococcus dysgalactiae subsp. equisimilis]QJR38591.1 FtsX-like permease family protein [Streptococcus dysgalactiae subsp. equisimilis]QUQ80761.1 Bacitracin export permease protein BceB [Streptococcus equi subsp. zooepidemicus]WOK57038.1 FtsX-like permease family protein 